MDAMDISRSVSGYGQCNVDLFVLHFFGLYPYGPRDLHRHHSSVHANFCGRVRHADRWQEGALHRPNRSAVMFLGVNERWQALAWPQ